MGGGGNEFSSPPSIIAKLLTGQDYVLIIE